MKTDPFTENDKKGMPESWLKRLAAREAAPGAEPKLARETARQRDELAAENADLEKQLSMAIGGSKAFRKNADLFEKQRDELLAACNSAVKMLQNHEAENATVESIEEFLLAAIARCQPAEKGDA